MNERERPPLRPGFEWLLTSKGRVIGAINWSRMLFHHRRGDEDDLIDLEEHRRQYMAAHNPSEGKE